MAVSCFLCPCCCLRCHSSLAQTLPPEEAPVDRPFWGGDDPGMPLPFDLADIITRVESLLWRLAPHTLLPHRSRMLVVLSDVRFKRFRARAKLSEQILAFCHGLMIQ